jgi:MarR family transcriptional regulator, protease production regulatory protein HPr
VNFLIKQKMVVIIRALYFCMEEHWAKIGQEHNVSPAQQHILFLLSINPALTPTQISELGCWHTSTVTRLLKPMENSSLINVSPDIHHRRYKIVSITKKGKDLVRKIVNSIQEAEHFPFPMDHLSEREIVSFLDYGQRFLDVMKGESFGNKVINAKMEGVDYV